MTKPLSYSEIKDVFTETRDELERVLMRRVRSADQAGDLVQDIFLKLNRLADRLPSRHEARLYLFRMATNIAKDQHRVENGRTRILEGLAEIYSGVSGDMRDEISHREDLAVVQSALEELPERTRRMFMLSRVEGRTHSEIAAQFQVSVSLVEKEIIRAVRHTMQRVGI